LKQLLSSSSGPIAVAFCTPTLRCSRHRAARCRATYGSDPLLKTSPRGSMRKVSRRHLLDCRNRWGLHVAAASRTIEATGDCSLALGGRVPRTGEQLPTMWTELLASAHATRILGLGRQRAAHNMDSSLSYRPLTGLRASSGDFKIRNKKEEDLTLESKHASRTMTQPASGTLGHGCENRPGSCL
jgi:hypothetical protein